MVNITYTQLPTYDELAQIVGDLARFVGSVRRPNPMPIIIPRRRW